MSKEDMSKVSKPATLEQLSAPESINENPLLTYEEFVPMINNFYMFFIGGNPNADKYRDMCRSRGAYQKCAQKQGAQLDAIAEALLVRYQERDPNDFRSFYSAPGYKEKLYEAYCLLHPYAENDDQLFD